MPPRTQQLKSYVGARDTRYRWAGKPSVDTRDNINDRSEQEGLFSGRAHGHGARGHPCTFLSTSNVKGRKISRRIGRYNGCKCTIVVVADVSLVRTTMLYHNRRWDIRHSRDSRINSRMSNKLNSSVNAALHHITARSTGDILSPTKSRRNARSDHRAVE